MRIKICGLTRMEDALLAARLGAWAVGFIFYEKSPRFIEPREAGKIVAVLPPEMLSVGVFVNAPAERIAEAARLSGIRAAQFHGDETPEALSNFRLETIKAFRPRRSTDLGSLAHYRPSLGFLIDSAVAGQWGGSGVLSDWALASEAKRYGPVILSGGLRPENVREAIREVRPFAVDVASGVEREPGIKDHAKVERFFKEARS